MDTKLPDRTELLRVSVYDEFFSRPISMQIWFNVSGAACIYEYLVNKSSFDHVPIKEVMVKKVTLFILKLAM